MIFTIEMSEQISAQKGGYSLFNYAVNMEKVKWGMTFNNVVKKKKLSSFSRKPVTFDSVLLD